MFQKACPSDYSLPVFWSCKTIGPKVATVQPFSGFVLDYRLKVRVLKALCRDMAYEYELFLQQVVLKGDNLA